VLVLGAAFALLRLWAIVGQSPVRTFDSAGYFPISFTGDAVRLWTVPVFYRALPGDGARVLAQVAVATVCWTALALAVAHSLRGRVLARAGALAILLLGLCAQVTQWDQFILSESLALSLGALLVAALLAFRLRPSSRLLAATLAVLVLWVFTRELHAGVFVVIAAVAIVWILVRSRRPVAIAVAVGIAALAAWGGYAATGNESLHAQSAQQLIVTRILEDPAGRQFLADRDMPALDALVREAETGFLGRRSPVLEDEAWRAWIDDKWDATYRRWLLRDPVAAIREPMGNFTTLLSGEPHWTPARPVLPSPLQDALWDRSAGDLPFWIAVALLVWLAASRRPRDGRLDAIGFGIAAACVPWYLLAWHLAPTQLDRLCVPIAAAFRIGLAIAILASLDRLLRRHVAARVD